MNMRRYLLAISIGSCPALAHARGGDPVGVVIGILIIGVVALLAYDKRLRENIGALIFLFFIALIPGVPALLMLAQGEYVSGMLFLGLTIGLLIWMFRKK